ncbi:CubicO group peptidase (beta-lactamase class C family) [Paraburkholderia sp. BL8N3]|nr:CubicO group peptidase (beta-lactamase class C family) [Paraburkholderia sp. BL8N3]
MPRNIKILIRWGAALPLIAALCYAGYMLSQLAPVGTGYAAKILCTGVFVSGRPADAVIGEDIMAGVHPLLKLVRASVDVERRQARASFLGFATREAEFRPGLGCTLALGAPVKALSLASQDMSSRAPPAAPPLPSAAPPADVDVRKLRTAVDSAFDEPDPREPRRTRALVVMYRGKVIAERYAPGFTGETPLIGWSMSKSVTGVLVGMLVKEGRLSLDASSLVPQWRGAHDPRARITLDEMLRMTSGLHFNEDYDDPLSDVALMIFTQPDEPAFAAGKPLDAAPGTRWEYSSGTSAILASVIRQALGGTAEDYLEFPRRALFDPLGMRTAVFEPDAAGMLASAAFVSASAHDWVRFGQFLLQDGVWNGTRLLPAGWVRYMSSVTALSPRHDFGAHAWVRVPEPFDSHSHNQEWPGPSLPADAFHVVGHEGQFVSVIPDRELVVVRLGLSRPESAWDHEAFLARLLAAIPAGKR